MIRRPKHGARDIGLRMKREIIALCGRKRAVMTENEALESALTVTRYPAARIAGQMNIFVLILTVCFANGYDSARSV